MIRGLTRLELSCCYRFLPDDPPAVLDFSAQAALQRLRVTVTERSAAPMPSSFETSCFRGLGALTDLRSLDFSHTALADIPSFVGELAPLTRLTALCLVDTAPRGCAFAAGWSGGDMAARLATALEPLSALERLELSFVPLGDEGAAMLAPALGHLHGLQHLGLLKTGVTDVGAAALWSHVRALPLNGKVLINSAATLPYGDAGTDSMQSGSVAIAQGHPGFPYPMV